MTAVTFDSRIRVSLRGVMGDDAGICQAARVSTLADASLNTEESDGLINFLMRNRHGTPFEQTSLKFYIEAPIFVFREFHRHRVGWSYNEVSGRYRTLDPKFYIPSSDRPLIQEGKPGAYSFVPGTEVQFESALQGIQVACEDSYSAYEELLELGVAKEVARTVLPVGIYSAMYATCNTRSLMHFLSLRTRSEDSKFPSFPQHEIEMVAKVMERFFQGDFPLTHAAFVRHGRVAP